MDEIVDILVERDGITLDEAYDLIHDVIKMMEKCNYEPDECEDIFMEELGLEPDYLTEFLLG